MNAKKEKRLERQKPLKEQWQLFKKQINAQIQAELTLFVGAKIFP